MDERTRRALLSGAAEPGRLEGPQSESRGLSADWSAPYGTEARSGTGQRQDVPRSTQRNPSVAQAVLDLSSDEATYADDERWVPPPNVEADHWEVAPAGLLRAVFSYLAVFALAGLPRLYTLFILTDPENPGLGWYGDAFHHWQIAYLSKEIGFSQGFLRLWDFKGVEYFWGLLHPLVLAVLFSLTGSIDIVIPRLLSLVTGSMTVVFIFIVMHRYFNGHVALAASMLAALTPVGIFSDASGMQEPLGIALLLLGVVLWPKRSSATGVAWALAGMVRAEFWLFGAALVLGMTLLRGNNTKKSGLVLGWIIPTLAYMKYLLDKTGNPIYPVYWNFLGNAVGQWMADAPLDHTQTAAMWGFRAVALVSVVALLFVLHRKPRATVFWLLGLGSLLFLSVLLGFTAYIRGFLLRFLVDRIFVLSYLFVGSLLAVVLLHWPRGVRFRRVLLSGGWVLILLVLASSQLAWKTIWRYYDPGRQTWEIEHSLASGIASSYEGGVISMMEDRPWITYFLAHDYDIPADRMQGQMYDAFAYMSGDPFANWEGNRESVLQWLDANDIRLLVFYSGKSNYEEMISREPRRFRFLKVVNGGTISIYRVVSPSADSGGYSDTVSSADG